MVCESGESEAQESTPEDSTSSDGPAGSGTDSGGETPKVMKLDEAETDHIELSQDGGETFQATPDE